MPTDALQILVLLTPFDAANRSESAVTHGIPQDRRDACPTFYGIMPAEAGNVFHCHFARLEKGKTVDALFSRHLDWPWFFRSSRRIQRKFLT